MPARNENPRSGREREGAAGRVQYTATTTQAAAFLTRLSPAYPVIAEYRPLAIGIHMALRAAMPGTSNKLIRRALARHCNQRRYLEALATEAGGPRYALDGEVCGEVTEPQRQAARARLGKAPAPCVPPPILHLPCRRGGAS